jgi:hypothetical protein
MARRQIFYSFHYDHDVFRVQQIRNIGSLDQNEPVSTNDWEKVRQGGDAAIQKWIDENMKYRSCVVVLIGSATSTRPWVKYEIRKAWEEGKGLVGVYIHNLKDPRTGKCSQGANPFDQFEFEEGSLLSTKVKCYNPNPNDPYSSIKENLEKWVEEAIQSRK